MVLKVVRVYFVKVAFLAPRQTTLYSSNKLASSTVLLLNVDDIIVTAAHHWPLIRLYLLPLLHEGLRDFELLLGHWGNLPYGSIHLSQHKFVRDRYPYPSPYGWCKAHLYTGRHGLQAAHILWQAFTWSVGLSHSCWSLRRTYNVRSIKLVSFSIVRRIYTGQQLNGSFDLSTHYPMD